MERRVAAAVGNVAGQPSERHAQHHQPADDDGDQPEDDEEFAHGVCLGLKTRPTRAEYVGRVFRPGYTRSIPGKKYPSSKAAVSAASEPCVALFSIDAPNSFRRVPASAFAGSVAPIKVRHFLTASGASSAMTIAGPDDMNFVRLAKNGRSRWTA